MLNHQPIFSVKELRAKIKNAFPNGIPNKAQKIKVIENFQQNLCSGKYLNAKEEEVKPIFLTQFFGEILGYEYNNANGWNLQFEQKTVVDSTKADAALGFFSIENKSDIRVVLEIKNARTALDKAQNRKDFKGSSVEQGFMYASKIGEKCKWVIVSNFLEIRLYLASDMTKYEKFDILGLTDEYEFARFYYLLAYGQLFLENISSTIELFLEQRIEKERLITNAFYKDYHQCREMFYCHLKTHNPDIEPLTLLEYAQTIIDRVVFISVIKDYDLISYNILKEIEDISSKSFAQDKNEFWRQLKYLFVALDKGLPTRVHKFNGGLFAPNEAIDNLVIKDVMIRKLFVLNGYDFESDLNINVLGHIFEQSITDIELLKKDIIEGNSIEYFETDDDISIISSSTAGLRKKDGVFYTPENITRYILKSTLGVWLDERKKEIGLVDIDDFPKDEAEKQGQIQLWEQYKTVLKSVKILDPACGSGAFLTQAFDYLFNEWQTIIDIVEKLNNDKIELKVSGLFTDSTLDTTVILSQIRKQIVNTNLFGVDLNFESVEITKLGLWLKSASKNDPLTSLDNNIKGGNSLIDDSTLTEKAFVWQNEFPDILNNGGFDFVVGNPPYGAFLSPEHQNYLTSKYELGTSETAICFIKQAFNLVKSNGILGFIIPKSYSFASNYESIRNFTWNYLTELVDCHKVWEEVKLEQVIVLFDLRKEHSHYRNLFLESEDNFIHLGTIDKSKAKNFGFFLNGVSEIEIEIAEKIRTNSLMLNDISTNIPGVPNQKYIVSEDKINRFTEYYEMIGGAEFNKYGIKRMKGKIEKKWVDFESAFVKPNSVLVQRIIAHIEKPTDHIQITACIPEDSHIGTLTLANTVNQIVIKDIDSCSQLFLWYVLNSKLVNWYAYRFIYGKAIRTMQFYNPVTSRLPIPKIDTQTHTLFTQKVKELLEIHKEYAKYNRQFGAALITLNKKFTPQLLKNWHLLDWVSFEEKFKKKKINLKLSDKVELSEFFEQHKTKTFLQYQKMKSIENELDRILYNLYQFDAKEIETIEKSMN